MIWGSRLNSSIWSSNGHAGMVAFRFLSSARETARHPDAPRTPILRYAQDAHCILRLRAGMHVRIASRPTLPKTGKPRCVEHCAVCFTEEVCFTDGIPLPSEGAVASGESLSRQEDLLPHREYNPPALTKETIRATPAKRVGGSRLVNSSREPPTDSSDSAV